MVDKGELPHTPIVRMSVNCPFNGDGACEKLALVMVPLDYSEGKNMHVFFCDSC